MGIHWLWLRSPASICILEQLYKLPDGHAGCSSANDL
jgi:hypothetical protein